MWPVSGLPTEQPPDDAFHPYDPGVLKGYAYHADVFYGQRCTGEGHIGNPFVDFSCHRKCYPADGAQSVRLALTNPEGEDWMDIDYDKVSAVGPMAMLYRASDCTGPKVGEARIPPANNTACLSWQEGVHSFQLLYLKHCGHEEFVTEGVESDYRMPSFVNWNDADGLDDYVVGDRHPYTPSEE